MVATGGFGTGCDLFRSVCYAWWSVDGGSVLQKNAALFRWGLLSRGGRCRMQPVGSKNLDLWGIGCQPAHTKHTGQGGGP